MISETLIKVYFRFIGFIKLIIWKLLYASRFTIGRGTIFYPNCKIMIEKSGRIKIGTDCFFNMYCSLNCLESIEIGDNCIFGENVKLYDHNHKHDINGVPFKNQGYDVDKISIGDNVWFGSDVIILSSVHIGNNVVISAGSIVTKDIPDNIVFIQKRSENYV